jgi:hypothetical protein
VSTGGSLSWPDRLQPPRSQVHQCGEPNHELIRDVGNSAAGPAMTCAQYTPGRPSASDPEGTRLKTNRHGPSSAQPNATSGAGSSGPPASAGAEQKRLAVLVIGSPLSASPSEAATTWKPSLPLGPAAAQVYQSCSANPVPHWFSSDSSTCATGSSTRRGCKSVIDLSSGSEPIAATA